MTQDLLKELFEYKDGKLINRLNISSRALKGKQAGCLDGKGYVRIGLNNKRYRAHRLIWVWHNGELSSDFEIDHINGKRDDNHIENLRLVTHRENHYNRKSSKGHGKFRGKWRARIATDGIERYLGVFNTAEEAREAYLNAKEGLHIIKDRKVA